MSMIATEVGSTAAKQIGKKTGGKHLHPVSKSYVPPAAKPSPTAPAAKPVKSTASYSYKGKTGTKLKAPNVKFPSLTAGGSPKTATLIIEWLIGMIFIIWGVVDNHYDKGLPQPQTAAKDFFYRTFAWSGVFFVLALLMRGKNSGKMAVMFGALLDVVLLTFAASSGAIANLTNILSGKGTGIPIAGGSSPATGNIPPGSPSTISPTSVGGVGAVQNPNQGVPGSGLAKGVQATGENIASRAIHATGASQSTANKLAKDILDNPVGQFINPLTNPLTGPILHGLEHLVGIGVSHPKPKGKK